MTPRPSPRSRAEKRLVSHVPAGPLGGWEVDGRVSRRAAAAARRAAKEVAADIRKGGVFFLLGAGGSGIGSLKDLRGAGAADARPSLETAQPTDTHRALAALAEKGLVVGGITTNHSEEKPV